MKTFTVWTRLDGNCMEVVAEDADEALKLAFYDLGIEQPTDGYPLFVTVRVTAIDDPEISAKETRVFDPVEPRCLDEEGHQWDCREWVGNGGGVLRASDCKRCELRRIENTWDQDPDTGDQGFETVTYERI